MKLSSEYFCPSTPGRVNSRALSPMPMLAVISLSLVWSLSFFRKTLFSPAGLYRRAISGIQGLPDHVFRGQGRQPAIRQAVHPAGKRRALTLTALRGDVPAI